MADKIVAIGLLSQRDLEKLGPAFEAMFPVVEDDGFNDLIKKLDELTGGSSTDKHDHKK